MASAFQPDYAGNGVTVEASPLRLYGVGAYVDIKFTRWIQLEGETRWLRFNEYDKISQDNYLGGPRFPIHHFHFLRATPYVKALVGYSKMCLGYQLTIVGDEEQYQLLNGGFTDIAYGGGADLKLNKRFSIRGDFEYQEYPKFLQNKQLPNQHLFPYGASVGVGYRIF